MTNLKPTFSIKSSLFLTVVAGVLMSLLGTAGAQPCVPPPPNLVNWWPFNTGEPPAHDIAPGTDNTATCSSGGCPTLVPGKVGSALSFDGNDSLMVPDDKEISLTNRPPPPAPFKFCSGFTIDAWIKTSQQTGVVVILDKRSTPSAPVGYHLFLSNGKLGLQLADGKPAGPRAAPRPRTRARTT
jgi:hypothetical protein